VNATKNITEASGEELAIALARAYDEKDNALNTINHIKRELAQRESQANQTAVQEDVPEEEA
jgi:hypothetical protein